MAQDRIRYLCQRLRERAALANVVEAARTMAMQWEDAKGDRAKLNPETLDELLEAIHDLHDAAYIELPDF